LPRRGLFYLGLVLIVASGIFGAVTHYCSVEVPLVPGKLLFLTEEGPVSRSETNVITYRMVQINKETIYPLSGYHFLTYLLLVLGLLIMLQYRPKLGWSLSVKWKEAFRLTGITRKLLIYLLIGLAIGLGIGYAVIPKGGGTAVFWQEICSQDEFGGIGVVAANPLPLPQSFKLSTISLCGSLEVITLHTYYFGVTLEPGTRILISINATAPIDFKLILVNRWDANVHALSNEVEYYGRVIINASQITSIRSILHVQERGLYIYTFSPIQPKPVATVTFRVIYPE